MKDQPLDEFIAFCRQVNQPFADFQLVEQDQATALLRSLVPDWAVPHFTLVGKHGSNSLIGRWQPSTTDDSGEQPYVWLDSEGTPTSVFAATTAEFLALLAYDTGAIYDIVNAWVSYLSEPDSYSRPDGKYTEERLAFYVSEAERIHPGYRDFIRWLDKKLGIQPATDPANQVGAAIRKYPDLKKWLTNKR